MTIPLYKFTFTIPYHTIPYRSACVCVQLKVCTVYACSLSETVSVTTAESQPAGLSAPTVLVVNSSSVELSWSPPRHSNGIIVEYQLVRTAVFPSCRYMSVLTGSSFSNRCGYSCTLDMRAKLVLDSAAFVCPSICLSVRAKQWWNSCNWASIYVMLNIRSSWISVTSDLHIWPWKLFSYFLTRNLQSDLIRLYAIIYHRLFYNSSKSGRIWSWCLTLRVNIYDRMWEFCNNVINDDDDDGGDDGDNGKGNKHVIVTKCTDCVWYDDDMIDSSVQRSSSSSSTVSCAYVQCLKTESFCGSQCYSGPKVSISHVHTLCSEKKQIYSISITQ